ncbi:hypothetical protein RUND412_003379 [Rhizina undulata]
MVKKKKRQNPEAEELLARPWCYYCERDFDDLKILIAHQKAKHFKCERCGRRLNTAGGLRVHMEQVHKETLDAVENALPGRESIDLEIFGTEGIPESEVAAHNQRILAEVAQREADRRAASGQNGPKRPKIDIQKELDPEEIKKKLEAHKKAMAAGGAASAAGTPGPVGSMSPGRSQSPGQAFDNLASPQVPPQGPYPQSAGSPTFQQGPYPIPQNSGPYPTSVYPQQPQGPYPTPYGQPFQPQPAPYARPAGPTVPYNGFQPQHGGFPGPNFNGQHQHNQYQQPHVPRHQPPPTISTLPPSHQIPGLPPRPNIPGLPPRPNFNSPAMNNGSGRGGPGSWNQPPHQTQIYSQPITPTGPSFAPIPAAYGGQSQSNFRPGFAQQSQGQHPASVPQASPPPQVTHPTTQPGANGNVRTDSASIANVTPSTEVGSKVETTTTTTQTAENAGSPPEAVTAEKKEKPKRETRLVYMDEELCPEEKRARLQRYAYHPPQGTGEGQEMTA